MEQVIEVLMIDDDIDNYESLKNGAAKQRIILRYSQNLSDAIIKLKESKKIVAVIIDGKGFITSNQKRGSEKEDFVHETLSQLKLLEVQQDRCIPKCVLTAWYDQLKDSLESRVRVFDKKKVGNDDAVLLEMLSYLKEEVKKSPYSKLRKKYSDVFCSVEAMPFENSSENLDSMVFKLFYNIENLTITKQDFNLIRDILEYILLALKDKLLPPNLFLNGKPNQAYCIRYINGHEISEGKEPKKIILHNKLNGEKRVLEHIGNCFDYIKKMSNEFSHINLDQWSHYSLKSLANAVCEILLWHEREFAKSNNPV